VLLSFVLLIGVAIAWELLRLRGSAPAELDPDEIQKDLSGLHIYEPMRRLLSDADFNFVAGQETLRPRWNRRFRARRRSVIALYLRDIRSDFNRIWSVCRLLAPMNPEPQFFNKAVAATHGLLRILLCGSSVLPDWLLLLCSSECRLFGQWIENHGATGFGNAPNH